MNTLRIAVAALLCLTACQSSEQPAAPAATTTVIEGATIIDGVSTAPIRDAVMVLDGSTIRAVGPRGSVEVPANARKVDATGKTIMPGMVNLHGHLGETEGMRSAPANYTLERVQRDLDTYLAYGIVHTVSLGRDTDLIFPLRADQRAGRAGGARLYTAYRGFTAAGGWQGDIPDLRHPATPEQAREQVRAVVAKGTDIVKVWLDDGLGTLPKLPAEVCGAIIDEAHRLGKKVFVHIFTLDDAKEMMRRGADGLAHIPQDVAVDEEFLALAKNKDVLVIPSLVRQHTSTAYSDGPDFLDDPMLPRLFPATVMETVGSETYRQTIAKNPATARGRAQYAISAANAKKAFDAGIRLGIGTDSGGAGRFQGLWEHREMELLVKAGLTPMQAIQVATINGARFLGIADRYGSLESGRAADFIVLNGNPLDDIRQSRRIDAVWMNGAQVDRESIAAQRKTSD
jgi:imidazolonepropionase-like amidohydrolase